MQNIAAVPPAVKVGLFRPVTDKLSLSKSDSQSVRGRMHSVPFGCSLLNLAMCLHMGQSGVHIVFVE